MYTFLSVRRFTRRTTLHQFVGQLTRRPIRKFAIFTRQPTENLPGIIISILHTTVPVCNGRKAGRQAGRARAKPDTRRVRGDDGEGGKSTVRGEGRKEGGFAGAAVTCHFCKRCLRILYTVLPSRRARAAPIEEYHLQHLPPLFQPTRLFVDIGIRK